MNSSHTAILPLSLPLDETAVRALRIGNRVELSGRVFTARDAVHHYLAAGNPPPCDFADGVIFHCGPVVVPDAGGWRVTAAGPTTSIREEPYMAAIIRRFHLRGIIGKGGMGTATGAACRECGCVYFHAVGGAAQLLAARIVRVAGVYWADKFGAPEAIWALDVDRFPAVVTMDSVGGNLHEQVSADSAVRLQQLLVARGSD